MNLGKKQVLAVLSVLVAISSAYCDVPSPNSQTPVNQLDHVYLQQVPLGMTINIPNMELEDGLIVGLHLQRFELLTPQANVIIVNSEGKTETFNPSTILLRGSVIGDDNSQVYIGISSYGTHGFVQHDNKLYFISTGPYRKKFQSELALRIANVANMPAPDNTKDFCQTQLDNDWLFPFGKPVQAEGDPLASHPPCREIDLAIETDWEFTSNLFGGNALASAEYALILAGAVGEIFLRDFNTRIRISFMRIWSENNDPYNAEGAGEALNQLRNHWVANESNVQRDLVHLFSGANLGGGVAWLSVVCSYNWGYAASGNLNGSFPYPLEDNVGGNWDPFVVSHETGHNFGTLHTHDGYDPPLDGCGLGDCSNANEGTIMSYCHTCSGGMTNIQLHFHPDVVNTVLGYLDGIPCDISSDNCCEWDLDQNGSVGTNDLLLLLNQWGTNPNGPPDFDEDGIVNTIDLLVLLANWGQCE